MQKHVNLVDLVKSFPTNIFLQNLASIQKSTSPIKFAHLAEKSENGSISNLSTKVVITDLTSGGRYGVRMLSEGVEGEELSVKEKNLIISLPSAQTCMPCP